MEGANIKIGANTYNEIKTITVDTIEGQTANYIYEGNLPLISITTKISV